MDYKKTGKKKSHFRLDLKLIHYIGQLNPRKRLLAQEMSRSEREIFHYLVEITQHLPGYMKRCSILKKYCYFLYQKFCFLQVCLFPCSALGLTGWLPDWERCCIWSKKNEKSSIYEEMYEIKFNYIFVIIQQIFSLLNITKQFNR